MICPDCKGTGKGYTAKDNSPDEKLQEYLSGPCLLCTGDGTIEAKPHWPHCACLIKCNPCRRRELDPQQFSV